MPIISSLSDADYYKFTMWQLVFLKYSNVKVKYAFKNRTRDVNLSEFIEEDYLRRELDYVRALGFRKEELKYLKEKLPVCNEEFLKFLKNYQLPEYNLEFRKDGIILEFSGSWSEAIHWETIALSIINQLYNRFLLSKLSCPEQETYFNLGRKKLDDKIEKLLKYPKILITDFGTRRRFSLGWQQYVVKTLKERLQKQFLGTSNVKAAMDYNLNPIGTVAHEMDMVMSGIMHGSDDEIRKSHNQVLKDWWDLYNYDLSIALTDTFGSDFFFKDMSFSQALNWKGLRQDSGDPIEFGEKAIKFYNNYGINANEKMIVFSDGLDVDAIIKIFNHFHNRIKVSFGWGTNLTNDLGFKPVSIVVKIVEANGHGCVKLSDNLAKAIGKPEDVERFKRIFGYTRDVYEECKY